MQSLTIIRLIILGSVVCCNLGCQPKFSDPAWNDSILTNSSYQFKSKLKWIQKPIVAGRFSGSEFLSGTEFLCFTEAIQADGVISHFRQPIDSQAFYEEIKNRGSVPNFCRGSAYGYDYSISKSWMPRSDPEGGWSSMNKRITYLTIRKNTTVVTATISMGGATNQVSMSEIVKEINKLVGEW